MVAAGYFKFREGAHHPKGAKAQLVGEWLLSVKERCGELTDQAVTNEAEADPTNEVVKPWFTWDSELASRKCHEYEAAEMRRSLVLVEVVPEQKKPVPAFVSIIHDDGHHSYEVIPQVVINGTDEQVERLLSEAQQQLNGLVTRIDSLFELLRLANRNRKQKKS